MTATHDIERIAEQEKRLRFARFDNATAWELGGRLRALCLARGVALSLEVRLVRETVFFCALPGTSPANADWIRRKRNTVELLQRSSYGVGLSLARDGGSLEQQIGVPTRDFSTHGGSFPVWVNDVGCVGAVTVSGIPQREDHGIVVTVLAEMCGVPLDDIALE